MVKSFKIKTIGLCLFVLFMLVSCGIKKQVAFDYSTPISLVSRESGSGTRSAFSDLFSLIDKGKDEQGQPFKKDLTTLDSAITNKTNNVITSISGDLYGFGYISFGSHMNTLKLVKIDGVSPTEETISNSEYAFSRPFNIVFNPKVDNPGVQDFMNFILSKEGQGCAAGKYTPVDKNAKSFVSASPKGKITVIGSSSVSPLMEKLIELYFEINPDLNIEMQSNDSTSGIMNTMDGIADLGMSSRDLTETELEQLDSITIAHDAIVLVVNLNNPIEKMSSEDVRNVYLGINKTWEDVQVDEK